MASIVQPRIDRIRALQGWDGAAVLQRAARAVVLQHPTNANRRFLNTDLRRLHIPDGAGGFADLRTEWQAVTEPTDPDFPALYRVDLENLRILAGANGSLAADAPSLFEYRLRGGETLSITAPTQLQWRNANNAIEPIRSIGSVVGTPLTGDSDNLVQWLAPYGTGTTLELKVLQDELAKILRLTDTNILGTSTLTNPTHLALPFNFGRDGNTRIYIYDTNANDYVEWEERPNSRVSTDYPVQFRDSAGTTVLYKIKIPFIFTPTATTYRSRARKFRGGQFFTASGSLDYRYSWIELQRAGGSRFITLCFDYDYVVALAGEGEAEIDPTIDSDPLSDADDLEYNTFGGLDTGKNWGDIQAASGSNHVSWFANFDASAIGTDTVTINSCSINVQFGSVSGSNNLYVGIVQDSDLTTPTTTGAADTDFSSAQGNAIAWSPAPSASGRRTSPDMDGELQTAVNTGDVGNIGVWMYAGAGSTDYAITVGYLTGYTGYQPNFDADYTISGGGGGQPAAKRNNTVPGMSTVRAGRRGF